MDDRYSDSLRARVDRDLARGERYLLAVPLLAHAFTLILTVLTAIGAGLGSLATAGSGAPAWTGGAVGAALGAAAGVFVIRARHRSAMAPGFERLAPLLALAVTNRRLLFYRRSVGNQAQELLAGVPRSAVAGIDVARGSFLRPRPVTIRLENGTALQFEGARADSVARLGALD